MVAPARQHLSAAMAARGATVGNCAPAVRRMREPRRSSSASDDDVGGSKARDARAAPINADSRHQIAATFLEESEKKAADLGHRQTINFNIGKYNTAVKAGKQQFADLPVARERAKNIKWRAIEHLDNHLEEFEQNFTRRGGKVIWAETAEQVQQEILAICKAKQCQSIVKSKSMATEEVHLNAFMESNGIEC